MEYILGGLSIIVVLYSVFFIIHRVLEKNDFKVKKKSTKNLCEIPTNKECLKIFGIALSFRILILLIGILIFLVFIDNGKTFNLNDALNTWNKWDAVHYIRISHGYTYYIENSKYVTLVFFPFYPLFIRIFSIAFSDIISGLIVSNLSFSLASVFIYKLVSMDYGKKTARITLILINIFPFAFFFSGIMSESMFLLTSTMTLYYVRKHNWIAAGFLGLLCALTRSMGVFIIFPAFIELIEEYQLLKRIKDYKYIIRIVFTKALPLFLIPLGFGIYLYINYRTTGDWFYFLKMQKEIWFQSYTHFFQYFKTNLNMFNGHDTNFILCVTIPSLIIVISSYIMLFCNVKKNITMYSVWLLVNIIVNTSMSWPLSVCRYFICALPLFIFMANYLKKHKYLLIGLIVISSILFGIYFVSYLKGSNIV